MMAAKRYRPHRAKPKPKVSLAVVGYDGKFEIGTRVVDDPYDRSNKLTVPANVKASGLVWMHSRGQIDDAQFTAGERFRALYEQAEIGSARGVDHSRPIVDGSGFVSSGVADTTAAAIRELAHLRHAVGAPAFNLAVALIGEGMTIADYAKHLNGGHPSRLMADNVGCMLRAALDGLIRFWGVGSGPPRQGR
jgi:hypothetical protein